MPLRQLAAEITREKLFERLHQELPYAATVETDEWKRAEGRLGAHRADHLRRRATARRRSSSARAAQMIKAISTAARREIAEIAERPVHLFLFVKVREKWEDDPERYRAMGIEFPKG